jgi:colicin import membrane protein/protein TonB
VDVQAVKFGKPRDLSFLPHKELVQLNKGPKPKLALTENANALPKPPKPDDKKPDEEDPLKRTHAELFKNATDQEQKGTVEEGDPNGLKGGTATVGKGPVYYQHLQAAVQNAWVVPTTIAEDRLTRLKATACIKIAADGKIVERALRSSSGDDRFDATLMQAIDSIQQFEPPTADVKDTVTSDGVCMNFAKSR